MNLGGISAYTKAAGLATGQGEATPISAQNGETFSNMLRSSLEEGINSMKTAEKLSIQATTGKADLTQVVTAITQAELTLQSIVAVRDRVIQSYQEIMRTAV